LQRNRSPYPNQEERYPLSWAASYSPGALEQIKGTYPSIVLLDSIAPVFSEARFVARLHAAISGVRVAMIDMELDQQIVLQAVREGVVGYVLEDASATEVAATIRAVSAGEAVCPPYLSMSLFNVVKRRLILRGQAAC
jgi:DNA-binding NarL/FixJ family response regulator